MRQLISIFLFFIGSSILAQTTTINFGGPRVLKKSELLNADLTSGRTLVVLKMSLTVNDGFTYRGDWKSFANKVHKTLRKVGIDAVSYIYVDDLFSGPELERLFLTTCADRQIKNVVFIQEEQSETGNNYSVLVAPFDGKSIIKSMSEVWYQQSPDLDLIFLRLGRQILRQQLVRSNFLILEQPNYLDGIELYAGNRLENYPTRLKSLPLAVVPFTPLATFEIKDPESLALIEAYNQTVRQRNEQLVKILESYPYDYKLVNETVGKELAQLGHQYVLFSMTSTAKHIRQMMNYPGAATETMTISEIIDSDAKQVLFKLPAQAVVTKFYLKQTIVDDLHPGRIWDADVNWETALNNFIFHITTALE